jgi:hypothetical protein
VTDDVDVAVREVLRFYANYDSSRYVGDRLVIRVKRAPDPAQLEATERGLRRPAGRDASRRAPRFPRRTAKRRICRGCCSTSIRRDFGRLRQLVDRLNALVPDATRAKAGKRRRRRRRTRCCRSSHQSRRDGDGG